MDLGLKGARVLVTAASHGLGAATARQFSREGAIVTITSRSLPNLHETAASINRESGVPVFTQACDLMDSEAIVRMVKNATEVLGGLDVLVTNAGGPPIGSFEDFEDDAWTYTANLTLLSAVTLIRAALPHLKRSKRAAILTIAAVSAKQPVSSLTLSNVIRPAVIGLTKTLSQELGASGIRVNSILPGTTDTERVSELVRTRAEKNNTNETDERAKLGADTPLGRIGTPEEFANAAVFLCSPAAGYITGVALPVDGGAIRATM